MLAKGSWTCIFYNRGDTKVRENITAFNEYLLEIIEMDRSK